MSVQSDAARTFPILMLLLWTN